MPDTACPRKCSIKTTGAAEEHPLEREVSRRVHGETLGLKDRDIRQDEGRRIPRPAGHRLEMAGDMAVHDQIGRGDRIASRAKVLPIVPGPVSPGLRTAP